MNAFRRARGETEEQARYLETVVQHIGVGLISFEPNGDVGLMNTAAKRLVRMNTVTNIRTLESLSKDLVEILFKLKSGDKALVKIERENETLQLAVSATELRMRDRQFTLVSLQNIGTELEEKEMEAWQNLIRVLTHEIMNSITPISSLASTVNDLLESPSSRNEHGITEEVVSDIRGALQTIEKRSQGLLHFVDAYRNLTRIPRPRIKMFHVVELFARVEQLMKASLVEKGIELRTDVPGSMELAADQELIEQVLINLLQNASHALNGRKEARIILSGRIDNRGHVLIEVADNGPGIPRDIQERVFIPFFTTKKEGTGIGLSLSRQIMHLHSGTISLKSAPNAETVFALRF
jgi:nitrogen fixation/metabolism regulation signal transduction histidine kinase